MKSPSVKMSLAALVVAGGANFALSPAQALPGLDRGPAVVGAPMIQKTWCGPYGCGGGYGYDGGYGWRPHPRPYGYGYGWRPRAHPWGYGYGYGGRPRSWGGYGYGGGWGHGWGHGW